MNKTTKTMKNIWNELKKLRANARTIDNRAVRLAATSGVTVLYVTYYGAIRMMGLVMNADKAITKAMRRRQVKTMEKYWNNGVMTTMVTTAEVPADVLQTIADTVDGVRRVDLGDGFVAEVREISEDQVPKDLIHIDGLEDMIKACDNQVSLDDMPD